MKRFLPLLLCFALLLSSCNALHYDSIEQYVNATNGLTKYSANFFIQVGFADGSVSLLYLNGSYDVDKQSGVLYRDGSETYLGDSWHETEFFENGCLYNAEGDDKYAVTCTLDDVLAQTIYRMLPQIDSENAYKISEASNAGGRLFSFGAKNMQEYEFEIVGDNIYALAALNVPQKDKTQYTDLKCEYTVSDKFGTEMVTAWQIQYGMSLYDTPPYIPGKAVNEEDYRLDINVRIKVVINSVGEDVVLPEYDPSEYN